MAAPLGRIQWIDSARGMTITLVVLFHAMRMIGNEDTAAPLVQANYLLGAIRLPAFFLISGVLTSFGIARDWQPYIQRRVWPTAWVFVVWGGVLIALSHVLPWPDQVIPASYMWQMWTDPYVHMWFLRDLIVMAIIARLSIRLHTSLLLGLAAGYYLYSHYVHSLPLELAIYFLMGVRLPDLLLKIPQTHKVLKLGLAGLLCMGFAAYIGIEEGKPLIALSGIIALLCTAALMGRVPVVNRLLHYTGTCSLQIYLMHMIIMGSVIVLPLESLPYSEWWLPFALTATGIGGSILAAMLLKSCGLGWLFAPPPLQPRPALKLSS